MSTSRRPERPSRPGVVYVALAHPQRTWVDALDRLLASRWDIEVVAAHTDTEWAHHAVVAGHADILLLHVDTLDALAVVHAVAIDGPVDLGVVALSDSEEAELLMEAVRAGVRGWVPSSASSGHLVRVLHGVAGGETWFPPRLVTTLLDELVQAVQVREAADDLSATLSARELEILQCLALGMTRHEIAERFVLSPHTVRTHINNLLHKLGVHSTLAAVSTARHCGLVPGDVSGAPPGRHGNA